MSTTSRVALDLVQAGDEPLPRDQWTLTEAAPFLAILFLLVGGGIWLHWWIEDHSHIEDDNDAARQGAATLAVDLAAGLGVAGLGVAVGILERRRRMVARALRQARQELERQADLDVEHRRLEMLGTLAAGLAHELGQPLSAARVGIEGIHFLRQLGREPSSEHLERTLSRVGMNLVAMTQTIDHLRSLAAPQSTGVGIIDLGACVAAVLADREQWLRFSTVAIEWTPPAQPEQVLADAAGVRLVLVNLLRNAVEAVATQSAERQLVKVVAGPGPLLAVHDSGPGIPAERLRHIFDPFLTTKPGAGRGVGLSLALASARRMGAELEVMSQPGSGTVFTLRFLTQDGRDGDA